MSPSSRIYNLVRGLAESGQCRPEDADEDEDEAGGMELSMRKVEERVIAKGFTRDQWQTAVMEYTNLDVSLPLSVPFHPKTLLTCYLQIWQTASNGTRLIFIVSEAADLARDAEYDME
jgi:DNA replication licensing factor MCM7